MPSEREKKERREVVWKFLYVSKCVGSLLSVGPHKNVMVEREEDILVIVFHEIKKSTSRLKNTRCVFTSKFVQVFLS